MSDVEDRLRTLLRERAATPQDNPTRRAEVRSRITAIRRRRVAGTALGLVLVTVAGLLLLTRLPGRNESLPPAVPKPPYFTSFETTRVVGYSREEGTRSDTQHGMVILASPNEYRPYLLVAWCSRAGFIHVSTPVGTVGDVPCKIRVGDHYEGALPVSSAESDRLFVLSSIVPNVTVGPDGVGDRWALAVLSRNLPDRLPEGHHYVLDGRRGRAGGSFVFAVPRSQQLAGRAFSLIVECVEGVRLTFRTARGELAVVACTPDSAVGGGAIGVPVSTDAADRLGLRPGQRIRITVERSGRDTDQWGVAGQQ